jgi:hypothetical protein
VLGLAISAALLASALGFKSAVEISVTGFSAKPRDGLVVCSWDRYRREDFSRYVLLKSSGESGPFFGVDPEVFSSDYVGDTRYEDGALSTGAWRYRLCILTRFKDVWTSPAIPLQIDFPDLKRSPPSAAAFE